MLAKAHASVLDNNLFGLGQTKFRFFFIADVYRCDSKKLGGSKSILANIIMDRSYCGRNFIGEIFVQYKIFNGFLK